MKRPPARIPDPPEVLVLGGSVVFSGLAAIDAYRYISHAIRDAARVNGIVPPPRTEQILAGAKLAAQNVLEQRETARAAADIADVRKPAGRAALRTGVRIGSAEVASMVKLGERQVRRRAGEFGGWREGRRLVFDRGLVQAYIDGQSGQTA